MEPELLSYRKAVNLLKDVEMWEEVFGDFQAFVCELATDIKADIDKSIEKEIIEEEEIKKRLWEQRN